MYSALSFLRENMNYACVLSTPSYNVKYWAVFTLLWNNSTRVSSGKCIQNIQQLGILTVFQWWSLYATYQVSFPCIIFIQWSFIPNFSTIETTGIPISNLVWGRYGVYFVISKDDLYSTFVVLYTSFCDIKYYTTLHWEPVVSCRCKPVDKRLISSPSLIDWISWSCLIKAGASKMNYIIKYMKPLDIPFLHPMKSQQHCCVIHHERSNGWKLFMQVKVTSNHSRSSVEWSWCGARSLLGAMHAF